MEKEHSAEELENSIRCPNNCVIEVPEEEKIGNKEKQYSNIYIGCKFTKINKRNQAIDSRSLTHIKHNKSKENHT